MASLQDRGEMTPGRWERIKELFDAALELPPEKRPEFLAGACGEDGSVRQESSGFSMSTTVPAAFWKNRFGTRFLTWLHGTLPASSKWRRS